MTTQTTTPSAAKPASPRSTVAKKTTPRTSAPRAKAPSARTAATTAKTAAPPKATAAPATTAAVNSKAPVVATASKPQKDKKPKMVRDSVTIPKAEYLVLDALKLRATELKTTVKKTELIRAGIKALAAFPDAAFLAAIAAVPSLKTGRPLKS